MKKQMVLRLSIPRIVRDGDLYSAYCDELELASSGTTEKKALKGLENAIISYCKSLEDIGILEERLKEKDVRYEVLSPRGIDDKRRYPVLVG